MPTNRFVVDTSVVLKWFLKESSDEALTDEADELLEAFLAGEIELFGCSHLYQEVSAVLVKRHQTQRGKYPKEWVQERYQGLREIGLLDAETSLPDQRNDVGEATTIALSNERTAYDMVFVAAAKRLDCIACTADSWGSDQSFSHSVHLKDVSL